MRAICAVLLASGVLSVMGPVAASGQGRLVGVKAGVNFATMGGADLNEFETACSCNAATRTAFDVGGFVSFDLSPVLKLRPELHYVGKGTKLEIAGTTLSINTSYVEIPVLLVVAPRVAGAIHPSLFGGGALALKAGCSLSGGGSSTGCGSVGFDVKSLDYGVVFGAGLGYAMGSGEILFDVRYNLGLADFLDTSPSVALEYRGLAVTAGYSFRIGR